MRQQTARRRIDVMARFAEVEKLLSLEPGHVVATREPGRARVVEQRLGIACPPSMAQIFDWAEGWASESRMLWGAAVAPGTLEWLAERFRAGPVARQRVVATHRFFDDACRISIVDDVWKVKAKAFADMDRLLEVLQPFFEEEL
jgi:hypothetical protein